MGRKRPPSFFDQSAGTFSHRGAPATQPTLDPRSLFTIPTPRSGPPMDTQVWRGKSQTPAKAPSSKLMDSVCRRIEKAPRPTLLMVGTVTWLRPKPLPRAHLDVVCIATPRTPHTVIPGDILAAVTVKAVKHRPQTKARPEAMTAENQPEAKERKNGSSYISPCGRYSRRIR